MGQKIQHNYLEGLKTLEDIYTLGGSELSPLIDRVHHHMSEIRREAQDNIEGIDSFNKIREFIERQFDNSVAHFFKKSKEGTQFHYYKETQKISLEKWNLLLEVSPTLFELIELFDLCENVHFQLGENSIQVKSNISGEKEFTSKRDKAYQITRFLLSKNILLTFDIFESSAEDTFCISFKMDYSHNEQSIYGARVSDSSMLGFSNTFERFKLKAHEFKGVSDGLCIVVNEDCSLEKLKRIPDYCTHSNFKGEVFYFSFLFRPVSIIMKRKGKLFSPMGLLDFINSGDKPEEGKESSKISYLYIDFFKTFND